MLKIISLLAVLYSSTSVSGQTTDPRYSQNYDLVDLSPTATASPNTNIQTAPSTKTTPLAIITTPITTTLVTQINIQTKTTPLTKITTPIKTTLATILITQTKTTKSSKITTSTKTTSASKIVTQTKTSPSIINTAPTVTDQLTSTTRSTQTTSSNKIIPTNHNYQQLPTTTTPQKTISPSTESTTPDSTTLPDTEVVWARVVVVMVLGTGMLTVVIIDVLGVVFIQSKRNKAIDINLQGDMTKQSVPGDSTKYKDDISYQSPPHVSPQETVSTDNAQQGNIQNSRKSSFQEYRQEYEGYSYQSWDISDVYPSLRSDSSDGVPPRTCAPPLKDMRIRYY